MIPAKFAGARARLSITFIVALGNMTLGRKILVRNAALLVALIMLGSVAAQGLVQLRSSVRTVLAAYRQLQRIENAETFVTAAKNSLSRGQTSGPMLLDPLQ